MQTTLSWLIAQIIVLLPLCWGQREARATLCGTANFPMIFP
jgi:hypothetical protein